MKVLKTELACCFDIDDIVNNVFRAFRILIGVEIDTIGLEIQLGCSSGWCKRAIPIWCVSLLAFPGVNTHFGYQNNTGNFVSEPV
jgi:hypothetical protein